MALIQIDYPEKTLFTYEIPVRITDLNYGNHLGHDTLVSLLHESRARFFEANKMKEADINGCGIILVDLGVSYRRQVFYGQVLRIEIAAGESSSRGCELVYRITDRGSGKLVALAQTGLLFFDYQKNRVVKMPESFAVAIGKEV